jgi:hypothetical protein
MKKQKSRCIGDFIPFTEEDIIRFWSKVSLNSEDKCCWLWTGGKTSSGYGSINIIGHTCLAHKIAWEIANGPIPKNCILIRDCLNNECVNIDHMHLKTFGINDKEINNKEDLSEKDIKRFWEHVVVDKEEDSCWLYDPARLDNEYGRTQIGRRKYLAHRISYIIEHGNIPDDLLVCHKCDVRNCVRPDHLWLGSYLDNNVDAVEKGRHGTLRGMASAGVKLTDEDVFKIRELYKSTEHLPIKDKNKYSTSMLGKMFNVSSSCIKRIVNNTGWKHLL